ncbi:MAG: hypothetical protein PHC42_01710 [Bacilli bacterium]|nr:hypothetical protein [Bacilli bacterium]
MKNRVDRVTPSGYNNQAVLKKAEQTGSTSLENALYKGRKKSALNRR